MGTLSAWAGGTGRGQRPSEGGGGVNGVGLQGWHGEPATSRQPVARRACSPAAWGRRLLIHSSESCHMHHQADHHYHLLHYYTTLNVAVTPSPSHRPRPRSSSAQCAHPCCLWTPPKRSIAGFWRSRIGSWEMKGKRPGSCLLDDSHHLQHQQQLVSIHTAGFFIPNVCSSYTHSKQRHTW